MQFGTSLSWLALPVDLAIQYANMFRSEIRKHFGELSYDPSTFPFHVKTNKKRRVVEIDLHQQMYSLEANPELFLVWADKMESAAKKILNTR